MFTHEDMTEFAYEAWGKFGLAVVDRWCEFNKMYFAGQLRPVPLVITYTQPYGRRLAYCSYTGEGLPGRCIVLNVPKVHNVLVADNNVLLHEMVHQGLFERGKDAAHASLGWRQEIMRIHPLITGQSLWAGRSKTMRRGGKVVRGNEAGPDGEASLHQMAIARWPHETGINLGTLGEAL